MMIFKKNVLARLFVSIFITFHSFCSLAQESCTFLIDVGADIYISYGDSSQFNVLQSVPPSAIDNISWEPSNTLSCGDCYNPYTYTLEDVCYIVAFTDTTNCTVFDTICVFVEVETGVNMVKEVELFELYPIPTTDKLIVKSKKYLLSTIQIFDIRGQVVTSLPTALQKERIIDISILESGSYYVKIKSGAYISVQRIIKI